MTLMMLVWWGGLIGVGVPVVRPSGRSDRLAGPSVDALTILEERFARGEIDQEEFERRRDVLRGKRAAGRR